MAEPLIRMEQINKFYGRVQALTTSHFRSANAEIVGLLGDNGAGKSTLIKVLSGAVPATSGDIFFRGKGADSAARPTRSRWGSRRSIRIPPWSRSSRSRATSSSAASR